MLSDKAANAYSFLWGRHASLEMSRVDYPTNITTTQPYGARYLAQPFLTPTTFKNDLSSLLSSVLNATTLFGKDFKFHDDYTLVPRSFFYALYRPLPSLSDVHALLWTLRLRAPGGQPPAFVAADSAKPPAQALLNAGGAFGLVVMNAYTAPITLAFVVPPGESVFVGGNQSLVLSPGMQCVTFPNSAELTITGFVFSNAIIQPTVHYSASAPVVYINAANTAIPFDTESTNTSDPDLWNQLDPLYEWKAAFAFLASEGVRLPAVNEVGIRRALLCAHMLKRVLSS